MPIEGAHVKCSAYHDAPHPPIVWHKFGQVQVHAFHCASARHNCCYHSPTAFWGKGESLQFWWSPWECNSNVSASELWIKGRKPDMIPYEARSFHPYLSKCKRPIPPLRLQMKARGRQASPAVTLEVEGRATVASRRPLRSHPMGFLSLGALFCVLPYLRFHSQYVVDSNPERVDTHRASERALLLHSSVRTNEIEGAAWCLLSF